MSFDYSMHLYAVLTETARCLACKTGDDAKGKSVHATNCVSYKCSKKLKKRVINTQWQSLPRLSRQHDVVSVELREVMQVRAHSAVCQCNACQVCIPPAVLVSS
jgi:hypothetical protein